MTRHSEQSDYEIISVKGKVSKKISDTELPVKDNLVSLYYLIIFFRFFRNGDLQIQ